MVADLLGAVERTTARLAILLADIDNDQFLGVFIWKRVEQHGTGDGEDRCIATDAQGQRQDGGDTESRVSRNHSSAVTCILPPCSQPLAHFRCSSAKTPHPQFSHHLLALSTAK